MPDDKPQNVICPECETENDSKAKRCSKCEFPLGARKDFERLATVTAKERRKQKEKEKSADEPVEDGGGFFDSLL
jgi:hypothetical protein